MSNIISPSILGSSLGLTVRQKFPVGSTVPGKRSAHIETRTLTTGLTYPDIKLAEVALREGGIVDFNAEPDATTGGLFELRLHTPNQRRAIFVTAIHVRVGAAVGWSLLATDGRQSGAGTDIDDPLYDMPIVTGTGNAYERLATELVPGASLRFKTAANVTLTPAIVDVTFVMLTDSHARPIA